MERRVGAQCWDEFNNPQNNQETLQSCCSSCLLPAGWAGWGTQLSATSPPSLACDTEPQGKQDGLLLHQKELSALVSPPA